MTNLSARQIKCLRLLWEEQDFRPAGYLAEKLQVSDKTVLQDIKAIQEYLDPFHVKLIRKTGRGIYLPAKARGNQELINSLKFDGDETVVSESMSTECRRKEIIKRLLLMDETGLSIQKLSEEFYVSRASIVNDFKSIERWGEQYQLTLVTSRKGRRFEGPEKGVRHAIAAWIRESSPTKNTEITPGEYMSAREDSQFVHTGIFNEEEIGLSGEMMEYLEKECGHTISEPYYSYLRDHILICISRARRKHVIAPDEENSLGMQQAQLDYACGLLEIARKKWDIPEQEIYYLYKYLASSDIDPKTEEQENDVEVKTDGIAACEFDLTRTVVEELSRCVLKALRITVDDNSELMNGLLRHIRPMLNRMMYDIHIQSSILKDMQENYGELLGLCQSALWCISRKYSLKEVTLEEASYIAAYYQALLETERMEKRILVVSNSGFGTQQLLVTKLRQHFPSYEIVDVVSMIQLEKRTDLEEIDFLISTVPLENITIPCILVSAVMSDADIRNIQDTVSANWLEEKLSLKYFRKQYERGKLELHTVDRFDGSIFKHRSPFEEKKTVWGHCLWTVIGINTEDRTSIYRREEESDLWYLVTHACTYDDLLLQLSDAYQMLCSAKGRKLTERCRCTEDLDTVFENQ